MEWQVAKIGGSILKGTFDFQQAVEIIIKRYSAPSAVIVSAFYGVTDYLEEYCAAGEENPIRVEKCMQKLSLLHQQALHNYLPTSGVSGLNLLQKELESLTNLLQKKNSFLWRDKIISFGERLAVVTFFLALSARGYPCKILWPEDIGLKVEGKGDKVYFCLREKEIGAHQCWQEKKIYLIPGFYGIDESGEIKIVGRGGSDYTAAVIAYYLGAKKLDLWKDVPGVLSGDPRYLKDARRVDYLSYEETEVLSSFGAGILHSETISPLREKGIKLQLFHYSGGFKPVTIISKEGASEGKKVKSLAFTTKLGVLKIKGCWREKNRNPLPGLLSPLIRAGIEIQGIYSCLHWITILMEHCNLNQAREILQQHNPPGLESIVQNSELGLLALVGENLKDDSLLAGQVLTALARNKIPVLQVFGGISTIALIIIVEKHFLKQALTAVHEEIFSRGVEIHDKILG